MIEVFGLAQDELFVEDHAGDDTALRRAIASRFTILGELGHGGMGTVYLANDARLGRDVAIKVVSTEATAGIGSELLLQEIRNVARLQHPNILPLHDGGTEVDQPYYVMPYVRSGSLRTMLDRRRRLPLPDVLVIVDGIAAALDSAHAQQILHCDIKPENVLIQGLHPLVMDFGIARTLHSEADEWIGQRVGLDYSAGTPAYVSPEQAAGDRALDQRSDVYSLACVAYEMMAGRPPFEGGTTQEVVSLRFRTQPPPLRDFAPEVPVRIPAVISRAMSLDPDLRPATATGFALELRHAASNSSAVIAMGAVAETRALGRIRASFGLLA